jgi:hypothetical protein
MVSTLFGHRDRSPGFTIFDSRNPMIPEQAIGDLFNQPRRRMWRAFLTVRYKDDRHHNPEVL